MKELLSGWKTYIIGALLVLNSGAYYTGLYARFMSPPADKAFFESIQGLLLGGGLMALRNGTSTEAARVENVVTGVTPARGISTSQQEQK